jgi:hypothetical protein
MMLPWVELGHSYSLELRAAWSTYREIWLPLYRKPMSPGKEYMMGLFGIHETKPP